VGDRQRELGLVQPDEPALQREVRQQRQAEAEDQRRLEAKVDDVGEDRRAVR
jgi:hypothetical protein